MNKKNNNTVSKIKSLKIKNFRGIKLFELDKPGKINIFLGRNGVGKTTLLEALFLNTGEKIENIQQIENFRKLHYQTSDHFLNPFYNLQPENCPELEFIIEDEKRILLIEPRLGIPDKNYTSEAQVNNCAIKLIVNGKEIFEKTSSINKNGEISFMSETLEKYNASYNSYTNINLINIRNLVKDGKKHDLINKLKKIIFTLETIDEVGGEFFVKLKGVEKLLPLKMQGDGLMRIADIFSSIYTVKNNFCLIDEIENGLHYRSQELMWEIICEQSVVNNVDLFITSHSYEMMQSLCKFLEKDENKEYRDLILVHTLIKKENFLEKVSYDYKEFIDSIKKIMKLEVYFK